MIETEECQKIIRIPMNLLQGCHNCKWYDATAYRCCIGAGVECEWENDGTYDGSPTTLEEVRAWIRTDDKETKDGDT